MADTNDPRVPQPYGADAQPPQSLPTQPVPQAQGDYAAQQAHAPSAYDPCAGQHAAQAGYCAPQATHFQAPAGTVNVQRKGGGWRTFGIAFAGAALACVLALGGFTALNAVTGRGASTVIGGAGGGAVAGDVDENATLAEQVAAKTLPSVAAIDVYTTQGAAGPYGLYGSGSSGELMQSSLGSGVVISEDGYIITNYHVIEGAEALMVTIEGEQYEADIVGSDPSSDIAVIKAKNAKGLTAVELGDSDNLTIGEWVMTIGSPFGLEQSVATGIVSATNRSQIMSSGTDQFGNATGESTLYTNMIQTDAAINPGNSGGALVNAEGKLIGINTLITSYSGNYSGVGFAIPVNYAVQLAQQIIDGEQPTHAKLGVSLSTVTSQDAQRYDMPLGAYVAGVEAGSGADEAGLRKGDVITAFDGQAVSSASDLMLDVRSKNPGDTVTLTVNRDGKEMDVEVTLGDDSSRKAASTEQQDGGASTLERLLQQYGYSLGQQDAA